MCMMARAESTAVWFLMSYKRSRMCCVVQVFCTDKIDLVIVVQKGHRIQINVTTNYHLHIHHQDHHRHRSGTNYLRWSYVTHYLNSFFPNMYMPMKKSYRSTSAVYTCASIYDSYTWRQIRSSTFKTGSYSGNLVSWPLLELICSIGSKSTSQY